MAQLQLRRALRWLGLALGLGLLAAAAVDPAGFIGNLAALPRVLLEDARDARWNRLRREASARNRAFLQAQAKLKADRERAARARELESLRRVAGDDAEEYLDDSPADAPGSPAPPQPPSVFHSAKP